MNINLNQKGNDLTATLTEGEKTLNYKFDVEEERAQQEECRKLAADMDNKFCELLKVNNNPSDDEIADIIGPYFTNPAVMLNGAYFFKQIKTYKLKNYLAKLVEMGKDQVDVTAQLMEDMFGKKEEAAPAVEEEKPKKRKKTSTKKKPLVNSEVLGDALPSSMVEAGFELYHASSDIPKFKIRYHRENYPDLPEVVQHGNFIDLYVAKGCKLKAGEFKLIDLGISVECPQGYWMQLVPRSSTFKKYGIIQTNSFGVIDTSYCGDNDIVMLPVYATRNTQIPKGERICQFTIVKDVNFDIETVDKLDGPDRGGFGSTGSK